jgi:hypothetical protein
MWAAIKAKGHQKVKSFAAQRKGSSGGNQTGDAGEGVDKGSGDRGRGVGVPDIAEDEDIAMNLNDFLS